MFKLKVDSLNQTDTGVDESAVDSRDIAAFFSQSYGSENLRVKRSFTYKNTVFGCEA